MIITRGCGTGYVIIFWISYRGTNMLILRNKLTKEKLKVLDTDDNTIEVATEKN